jgi:predicted PurR-regulated permease PerM
MRPHWTVPAKITVIVVMLVITAYLLYRFSVVIPPLVIAVLLAFILNPIVDGLAARLRLPRTAAVAGLYLILLGLLVTAVVLLIPELVRQALALSAALTPLVETARRLSQTTVVVGELRLDLGTVMDNLTTTVSGSLQSIAQPTLNFLLNVVEFVVFSIVVLVVSFYLVKDGGLLLAALDRLTPPRYRSDVRRLQEEVNTVWSAFLRGQVILAVVVATIITAAGFIVGLPFALALGILAGLLEFLPSLGHGLWLAVALGIALVEGPVWLPIQNWAFALLVLGLHLVFQQVDLNFLIPRIIGRHIHLHPLAVILGIVVGASLAGVLGMALAAPVIASLRILGRYVYAGLFDLDPFEHLPPASEDAAHES